MPAHDFLVLLSGIFEAMFGLLLFFPFSRRVGAWGIILLLIAVFPANVQMMINYLHENNPLLWLAIVRLPFQLLLIRWAYAFTNKRLDAKNSMALVKDKQ